MNLRGWLRALGLERYEAAFRENAIDVAVLLNLTAEDLKDLGVSLVGHRRKLLDAIAKLRTAPPEVLSATDEPLSDSAERRQVTVMFSDLVGSTALSARMDPEDLRELISSYQKCVTETVRRFGGFVAKFMGDGVLVYFGYPQAHEDDAERAVRAGLELIGALAGLKMRAPLQNRVGIATGLVVVGDLIGSGEAQERGIVGETVAPAGRDHGVADHRHPRKPRQTVGDGPDRGRIEQGADRERRNAGASRQTNGSKPVFVASATSTAQTLVAMSSARAPPSLAWVKRSANPVRACISRISSGRSSLGRRASTAARSATRLGG